MILWLEQNNIAYEACVLEPQGSSYFGGIYIDVPIDKENAHYDEIGCWDD